MSNEIFPAELVIKSLRDSGYKNAAYALAELVDNSVQAGASKIDVYLCEITTKNGKRNLENILVIDNGEGMSSSELISSLRFGDGSRLKKEQWTGIGKFGMGLPSASISQCSNVRVWSRKKGADEILSTYLDINEIRSGELKSIPKPKLEPLPKFMPKSELLGKHGTIVMWSNLDRCTWKTGKALHKNSAFLLGRIYRYFIDKKNVQINFIYYDLDENKVLSKEKLVTNDPMYLMSNTQCPEPYNVKPLFELWDGEARGIKKYTVDVQGTASVVELKFSVAKKEARNLEDGKDAGSSEYGKDAKKNIGISLVRKDRELEMDQSFVLGYQPTERWWGVEVLFDPILDDVFGVTNNKQHARHFSEMANHRYSDLIDTYETVEKVEEELKKQGDPTWVLFRVCHDIKNGLEQIRKEIVKQTIGRRKIATTKEKPMGVPETILTNETIKRIEDLGEKGKTDQEIRLSKDQKIQNISSALQKTGFDLKISKELAENIVASGTRYNFEETDFNSAAFFDVRGGGAVNLITINTSHPFYKLLYNQIVPISLRDDEVDPEKLKHSLDMAALALKIIIGSWARLEDEASDKLKVQLQDIRHEWGKLTRDFLDNIEA